MIRGHPHKKSVLTEDLWSFGSLGFNSLPVPQPNLPSTLTLKLYEIPPLSYTHKIRFHLSHALCNPVPSSPLLSYLYHSSFRLALSRAAFLAFGPQRSLTAANLAASRAFFSGGASQHIATNSGEQLNFFANLNLDHKTGFKLLNRFISAASASVRWWRMYPGPSGLRRGGREVFDEVLVDARSWRRLSSLGRNLRGVWRAEGIEDGGLNIMWSCLVEFVDERKEDSGFTLSLLWLRL